MDRLTPGALTAMIAAAPERGPQTGDRRAVSYAGLVLDLDRAHRREELLDEIVLLVVERRSAEVREAERTVQPAPPGVALLPAAVARGDHTVGDHVHRLIEIELPPVRPVRA